MPSLLIEHVETMRSVKKPGDITPSCNTVRYIPRSGVCLKFLAPGHF